MHVHKFAFLIFVEHEKRQKEIIQLILTDLYTVFLKIYINTKYQRIGQQEVN